MAPNDKGCNGRKMVVSFTAVRGALMMASSLLGCRATRYFTRSATIPHQAVGSMEWAGPLCCFALVKRRPLSHHNPQLQAASKVSRWNCTWACSRMSAMCSRLQELLRGSRISWRSVAAAWQVASEHWLWIDPLLNSCFGLVCDGWRA